MMLLAMWLAKRPGDAAAQTAADAEPEQKTIRIQTGADGKIDINQLLEADDEAKGKTAGVPVSKQPTWDPNGVEDFPFTNCDGRTITKQDLLGRPWVAAFVFTHCLTTCPMITQRMRELQDRLKHEDIRLVTFAVDPKRDTPEVLKQYAELNGADLSRWHFLWGDAVDIYGLIHRSFQMPAQMPDEVTGNYQPIHSNNVMLVDSQGVVQGKYLGTNEEQMASLVREIRRMLHPKETSAAAPPAEMPSEIPADAWYMTLPAVNAGLNGFAAILLAAGYVQIKQRRVLAHRNLMLSAFAVSIAFLACYLVYHAALHQDTGLAGKKFAGQGVIRPVYFTILITHVLLAVTVPVLASITIYRGLKADWPRHRRIAKITFPIWMYVSVTGVIIYLMLYHWPTTV